MSAFLCLDPIYVSGVLEVLRNHKYIPTIIKRYEKTQEIAECLSAAGWKTEMQFDDGVYVICRPPTPVEEESEIKMLLDSLGIDIEDYGCVDYDDDIDPQEDEYIDDCGSCDCEDDFGIDPLMNRKIAEAITGKRINVVDLVEDYKVIIHLEGGDKLIFDEDDGVFLLS